MDESRIHKPLLRNNRHHARLANTAPSKPSRGPRKAPTAHLAGCWPKRVCDQRCKPRAASMRAARQAAVVLGLALLGWAAGALGG